MASLLKQIKIDIKDMKSLPEYDRYQANHVKIDAWMSPAGPDIVYSSPSKIVVELVPMEVQPIVSATTVFWPFRVIHAVSYDPPRGMSVRSVMDRNGSYTGSEDYDIGILWINTLDYEELLKNPTQETLDTILNKD